MKHTTEIHYLLVNYGSAHSSNERKVTSKLKKTSRFGFVALESLCLTDNRLTGGYSVDGSRFFSEVHSE